MYPNKHDFEGIVYECGGKFKVRQRYQSQLDSDPTQRIVVMLRQAEVVVSTVTLANQSMFSKIPN